MINQIQQIDGYESLAAEQIANALAELVEQPVELPITVSEITNAVGMDGARLVVGTIQQAATQDPLLGPSLTALSTTGMRLDSPERQGMIDQLAVAGSWPDQLRDTVKSLGVRIVSRYTSLGGVGDDPTLEQVQSAINQHALQAWWSAQEAVVSEGVFDGTLTTKADAVDAIEVV